MSFWTLKGVLPGCKIQKLLSGKHRTHQGFLRCRMSSLHGISRKHRKIAASRASKSEQKPQDPITRGLAGGVRPAGVPLKAH